MTRSTRSACKIDVIVESSLWKKQPQAKATVRRAVTQAATALSTPGGELAIVLADDPAIRLLNRDWRGIDAATNVLSFPIDNTGGGPSLLGDVILAYETIAREARDERKPFAHHLAHLAIHGFLHLLGYDHEHDEDAETMEQAERSILQKLAIADPYRVRATAAKKPAKRPAGARKSRRPRMTRN